MKLHATVFEHRWIADFFFSHPYRLLNCYEDNYENQAVSDVKVSFCWKLKLLFVILIKILPYIVRYFIKSALKADWLEGQLWRPLGRGKQSGHNNTFLMKCRDSKSYSKRITCKSPQRNYEWRTRKEMEVKVWNGVGIKRLYIQQQMQTKEQHLENWN